MIAVDTSALLAIVLSEPAGFDCDRVLEAEANILVSAGTLAESLIVAGRRGVAAGVEGLVGSMAFEVVPVTALVAERAAEAYRRWGKGVHPAGLNLSDCFAYETAKTHGCPLLFVGDDFARSDLASAI